MKRALVRNATAKLITVIVFVLLVLLNWGTWQDQGEGHQLRVVTFPIMFGLVLFYLRLVKEEIILRVSQLVNPEPPATPFYGIDE